MKTVITLTITFIFSAFSHSLLGSDKPEPVVFAKAEITAQHYIAAMQDGETEYLESLFAENLRISTPDNKNQDHYGRSALIKHLKESHGVHLKAISNFTFVENHKNYSVIQIKTEFDHFTRLDYLTLQNGKNGWKISNIVVTYP